MDVDTGGRTGRRPGPVSSRQAILDAAREEFTLRGFKGATVRAIAGRAGVDPALIRHFFGGKDGLFRASMEIPGEAFDAVLAVLDGPRDEWGERLVRGYLSLWEDPVTAAPLRATVASALGNEEAMDRFRDHLVSRVLAHMGPRLPQDDPGLRFAAAITHVVGIALGRYLLKAPPLVEHGVDDLVALVGPTVQRYLTDPLPAGLTSPPR